jgi:hypothetical protein
MVDESFESRVLDDDAWRESVRFWRAQVDRLAESLGQRGEWPSWEPRAFGNGSPMSREDLAICDGRSERLERAFHISQWRPDENGPYIHAHANDYASDELWIEDESRSLPRARLVIDLALSEEIAQRALQLLRLWMTPATTVEEMNGFIEATVYPG